MAVNAACACVGCASATRPVPRDIAGDVREYLRVPSRAPSADERVADDPQLAWRADLGRGTVGALAVGEGVSVVASVDRWVYAFDTRSGRPYWRFHADAPYGTGPVISGGRVFAASEGRDGALVALDLYTGRRLWRRRVGDVAAPLVAGDSLVFGATELGGTAFALHARTGRRAWSRYVGASRSGPLVVGRSVMLVTLTDTLFVLDAATGAIRARTALETSTLAPLALADDSTAVVSTPDGVIAVTVPQGRIKWRVATSEQILGAPAVARDTVFALGNRCTLWAIPVRAPTAADSTAGPADCVTVAGPLVLRDGVLVATISGLVALLDRTRGGWTWTRRLGGELRHPPVVLNRQIVIGPTLGDVVSYR